MYYPVPASQDHLEICESTTDEIRLNGEIKINESTEKHCKYHQCVLRFIGIKFSSLIKLSGAIWNVRATSILLKLYEEKLEMIETPKKKTRIWIAIAESLRDYSIEVCKIELIL